MEIKPSISSIFNKNSTRCETTAIICTMVVVNYAKIIEEKNFQHFIHALMNILSIRPWILHLIQVFKYKLIVPPEM